MPERDPGPAPYGCKGREDIRRNRLQTRDREAIR